MNKLKTKNLNVQVDNNRVDNRVESDNGGAPLRGVVESDDLDLDLLIDNEAPSPRMDEPTIEKVGKGGKRQITAEQRAKNLKNLEKARETRKRNLEAKKALKTKPLKVPSLPTPDLDDKEDLKKAVPSGAPSGAPKRPSKKNDNNGGAPLRGVVEDNDYDSLAEKLLQKIESISSRSNIDSSIAEKLMLEIDKKLAVRSVDQRSVEHDFTPRVNVRIPKPIYENKHDKLLSFF
jgi:hypothetical protein